MNIRISFSGGGLLPVEREGSQRNKTRLCASFTRADLFLKEFQGSEEAVFYIVFR